MILVPGVRVSGPLFYSFKRSFGSRFPLPRFCFLLRFLLFIGFFFLLDFSIVGSARNRVFSGGFRKIACLDAI